jgi:hypothetical protein
VNDQENGAIVLPAGSRAPLAVAVYVVAAASAAPGVKVTVRLVGSYAVLPDTVVLLVVRARLAVPAWMSSLNVAVTTVFTGTPVAPAAGVVAVTDGGVVSVAEVWKTTSTQ